MSKKHLLLFLVPVFLLCIARAFYLTVPGLYNLNVQDTAEDNAYAHEDNLENSHKLIDNDGDGFSKWFEENISNTSDSVPNDRYVIMVSWAGRNYKDIDQIYEFLTQEAKIPESNVIDLGYSNCTYDKFKDALNEIIKISDENDIVLIMYAGHGGDGILQFRDETIVRYEELDQYYFDRISAKAVIVIIDACLSGSAIPYLRDGPCPRIVMTQCSATETAGGPQTAYRFLHAFEKKSPDKDRNHYISVNEAGRYVQEELRSIYPDKPDLNKTPQMSNTSHENLYLVEIEVKD